jgi:hypothetical protein
MFQPFHEAIFSPDIQYMQVVMLRYSNVFMVWKKLEISTLFTLYASMFDIKMRSPVSLVFVQHAFINALKHIIF